MKLKNLLTNVDIVSIDNEDLNLEVESVSDDSRRIPAGDMFVAIKGLRFDPHTIIEKVIENGAKVIVHESDIESNLVKQYTNVTFVKVTNSREALALIASNYYDNPSKKLRMVGITGTNGKTTSTSLIYQLLSNAGKNVGLIGTVEAKIGNESLDTGFHVTNPEPLELHRFLNRMVEAGCEIAVVEISSHGIDQKRHFGINFEVAGITNVTPDHIDYHGTFENYLRTKAMLLSQAQNVFLNVKHDSYEELSSYVNATANLVDYTKYEYPSEFVENFPGDYNKHNAAMAIEICKYFGLKEQACLEALKYAKKIKGRFEYVIKDDPFSVVIDFASDHVSLENVLKEARKLTKGKIINVFGSAGWRDRLKRPKMGRVSKTLADITIVTAEDPRTDDLDEINKAVEQGVLEANGKKNEDYFVINDRQEAINFAVRTLAKPGDMVIITGKGHEQSMCIGNVEYPWSEFDAVKQALVGN